MRNLQLLLMGVALASGAWACSGHVTSVGAQSNDADSGAGGHSAAGAGGSGASAGGSSVGGQAGSIAAGGTGNSAGASGQAGAAGGAADCLVPALDAGPTWIESYPDTRMERHPILVPVKNDPSRVVLTYHWTSMPGGTVTGVRYVPFAPWGEWSFLSVGPNVGIDPTSFIVDQPIAASAGPESALWVLTSEMTGGDTSRRVMLGEVGAPYTAWTKTDAVSSPMLDTELKPRFVVGDSGERWIGYTVVTTAPPSSEIFYGGRVQSGGHDGTLNFTGCGTLPLVADAASVGGEVLVANSTSRLCCTCDDGVDGPPDTVVIRAMGVQNPDKVPLVFKAAAPVVSLKLVPRDDGAWLVVVSRDPSEELCVSLARVTPEGDWAPGSPSYSCIAHMQGIDSVPTAASIGNHLALAWLKSGAANVLTVRNSSETIEKRFFISALIPVPAVSQVSLLASPARDKLLLAWSGPDESEESRIAVARLSLDCSQ